MIDQIGAVNLIPDTINEEKTSGLEIAAMIDQGTDTGIRMRVEHSRYEESSSYQHRGRSIASQKGPVAVRCSFLLKCKPFCLNVCQCVVLSPVI